MHPRLLSVYKRRIPLRYDSGHSNACRKAGMFLRILCGCHAMPERSFHFHGNPFPICARCTGELIGILAGIPITCIYGIPDFQIAALMMLPLIVDGTLQRLTSYESNNIRRLITGILFGIALVYAFLYFHQVCIRIAGVLLKLLGFQPDAVDRIMQQFLP